MEKDKNAQIEQLLRNKESRETSTEKKLREMNSQLEDEIKIKEKRYMLLLQQIESVRREKKEEEVKEQEAKEAKVVSELLSKSSADLSTKAMQ